MRLHGQFMLFLNVQDGFHALWSGGNKQKMVVSILTSSFPGLLVSFTSVAPNPNVQTLRLTALMCVFPFNPGVTLRLLPSADQHSPVSLMRRHDREKKRGGQKLEACRRRRWAAARHVPVIRGCSLTAVQSRLPSGCLGTESQREGSSLRRLKLNNSIFHLSRASRGNQ